MLASLLFGLIAWIIPIINLLYRNKVKHNNMGFYYILSLSACSISLYIQILFSNYFVQKEDWSALMDTTNSMEFASSVLLVVTITLNIITLNVYQKININN